MICAWHDARVFSTPALPNPCMLERFKREIHEKFVLFQYHYIKKKLLYHATYVGMMLFLQLASLVLIVLADPFQFGSGSGPSFPQCDRYLSSDTRIIAPAHIRMSSFVFQVLPGTLDPEELFNYLTPSDLPSEDLLSMFD